MPDFTAFPIPYVDISTTGALVAGEFPIEVYGAVGDMIYGNDAAIASGTDDFTSASASFTVDDVGKPIVINGAGAAGVPLITTISAFVSATAVTLADNAATTVVSGDDKLYYYGTDDTAAFQAAIDYHSVNGGKILLGAKSYMVGAVEFPVIEVDNGPFQAVTMEGPTPPPGRHWNGFGIWTVPLPTEGFSIVQYYPGTGSLLTTASGLATNAPTAIFFNAKNINFRVPVLKAVTGLDLRRIGGCLLENVTVDTSFDDYSYHPEPVVGGVGVYLPQEFNDAQAVCRTLAVANFDEGLHTYEHTDLQDMWFWRCQKAILPHGGSHSQFWNRVDIVWCPYGVYYGGASLTVDEVHLSCNDLNFEDAAALEWSGLINHIYDPTDKLKGRIFLHRVQGGVGFASGWSVNGGANLGIKQYSASGANEAAGVLLRSNFGDDANDEASLPIDEVTGEAWQLHGGGTWAVVDGWASNTVSPGVSTAFPCLDAGVDRFRVSCLVHTSPTANRVQAGVCLKLSAHGTNLSVCITKRAAQNNVELFQFISGAFTSLATGFAASVAEDTIYLLEADYCDNVVTVRIDGEIIITHVLNAASSSSFDNVQVCGLAIARTGGDNDDGGSLWKKFSVTPL